ncbi:MAG: hypothetical protein ACYDEH_07885 [Acidimicrobiales bacterium]
MLGRVPSSYYRKKKPVVAKEPTPRPAPPNALSEAERARVLALLCEDQHVDSSVAQVHAETLDDGTHLCSQSTMLRILRANKATKDRRRQRTHPAKKRPELIATAPNEIWSWDIERHEALLNREGVQERPSVSFDLTGSGLPCALVCPSTFQRRREGSRSVRVAPRASRIDRLSFGVVTALRIQTPPTEGHGTLPPNTREST